VTLTLPSKVALGTMHGKAVALAPPLSRIGIALVVPESFDTDRFGTFSGEVPRHGTMEEAARAKALAAARATGLPVGLASEGAYGPHPVVPFLAFGVELLLWHDTRTGHEVTERLTDDAPAYDRIEVASPDDLAPFLARIRFPETALVVSAAGQGGAPVAKGITDPAALTVAVATALTQSPQGRAILQTDMRAHLNPRRMQTIARLAERFATRIAQACPSCAAPGWGLLHTETGLPCADCGTPTALVQAEIHVCTACGRTESKPRRDGRASAEPANCPMCNP
jgi:hypothetical protein